MNDSQTTGIGAGLIILFVILGIIYLGIMVVMILAQVRVIQKSGYSGWWWLMSLVPIGNIIVFLMWAFREWPAQRELRELRAWAQSQGGGAYPPSGGYPQPPRY